MINKLASLLYGLLLSTTIACASDLREQDQGPTRFKIIIESRHNLDKMNQEIGHLSKFTTLEEISVQDLNEPQTELLTSVISGHTNLRVLSFTNYNHSLASLENRNRFKHLASVLSNFTNLTTLDLNCSGIDKDCLEILAPNFPTTLTELDLSKNNLENTNIASILSKLSHLRVFKLVAGKADAGQIISALPTSLQVLDLTSTTLNESKDLSKLTNLEALKLNPRNRRGLRKVDSVPLSQLLEDLTPLSQLREFSLSFDPPSLPTLPRIIQNLPKTLETLELHCCKNIDESESLDLIKTFPINLQELYLIDIKIDKEEIKALSEILSSNLRQLSLRMANLNTETLSILLPNLSTSLEVLVLERNNIDDKGLEILSAALSTNLSMLQVLDLYNNDFTQNGAQRFLDMLNSNTTLVNLIYSDNLKLEIPQENYTLQRFYNISFFNERNERLLGINTKRAAKLQDLAYLILFLKN